MTDESPAPRYLEYRPPPDLAAYVACTWASVSAVPPEARRQPVIPDGCADIIVFGDEPPHVAAPTAAIQ